MRGLSPQQRISKVVMLQTVSVPSRGCMALRGKGGTEGLRGQLLLYYYVSGFGVKATQMRP